jgi:ribose transport system substrate-binding protein
MDAPPVARGDAAKGESAMTRRGIAAAVIAGSMLGFGGRSGAAEPAEAPTPPAAPKALYRVGTLKPGEKFRVGFSQCTVKEPWRVLFNELIIREAARHPELELEIQDADDKTEKQVADVKSFIVRGFDAILISPKEAPGLTGVVKEATEKGVPVIVLDRDVNYKDYACFVGGDNMKIGRAAGRFAVDALGGAGKAKGVIYEICGGLASTPAQERRDGFHEIVDKEPGIKVVGGLDGDWKLNKGHDIMQDALKTNPKIDLVYAHNDPMAYGAWQAAKQAGREKDMKFVGIDAIPQEGALWVRQGKLSATFLYEPPGAEGLRQALKVLTAGAPDARRISLETRAITAGTVDQYLADMGEKPLVGTPLPLAP